MNYKSKYEQPTIKDFLIKTWVSATPDVTESVEIEKIDPNPFDPND